MEARYVSHLPHFQNTIYNIHNLKEERFNLAHSLRIQYMASWLQSRNIMMKGPGGSKDAQFMASRKQSKGTLPESNGPGTRYNLQSHTSMTHLAIPRGVLHQSPGWIPKPIRLISHPHHHSRGKQDLSNQPPEQLTQVSPVGEMNVETETVPNEPVNW